MCIFCTTDEAGPRGDGLSHGVTNGAPTNGALREQFSELQLQLQQQQQQQQQQQLMIE